MLNIGKLLYKNFSTKKKVEETFIYIMNDKYSIKPQQEYKILHEIEYTKNENNETEEKSHYTKYMVEDIETAKKEPHFSTFSKKYFFPRNFPHSMKPGYREFSNYLFISNLSFNTMNFMSTQAMINSLGLNVGPVKKYALSAGLNWVIKDSIGQLGSIFFATRFAHYIEKNSRDWRIIAHVLLNFSLFLEILTVIYPQYFLLIASVSNIIKLTSLSIFGVTRASLFQHYAKENNIADVTNKATTQNNMATLLGNLVGLGLSLLFPNNFNTIFISISALTVLHLGCAVKSMNYIVFDEFNFQRMYLLCEEFLKTNEILTPIEIFKRESFFFKKMKNIHFCEKSLDYLIKNEADILYSVNLIKIFNGDMFMCYVSKKKFSRPKIFVSLRVEATNIDIFIAFLYSIKLNSILKESMNHDQILELLQENLDYIHSLEIEIILEKIKNQGWSTNFSLLEEKFCRFHILYKN